MDALETTLTAMTPFGYPKLFQYYTGWYCFINMIVAAAGAKFEVASDFGHPTASAAAQQCLARMRKVIGDIADATATEIKPIAGSLTHG